MLPAKLLGVSCVVVDTCITHVGGEPLTRLTFW